MIRDVKYWDVWALIAIKGQSKIVEDLVPYNADNHDPWPIVNLQANIPLVIDVDHDGIPDSIDTDRDNDGLLDAQELIRGTDPLDPDTNDDGILDNVNRAPVLDPMPDRVIDEGGRLTIVIKAQDPDDDAMKFMMGPNMPAFAQATGYSDRVEIVINPGFKDAGIYRNITISVSDSLGLTDTKSFTLTVNNVNAPPVTQSLAPVDSSINAGTEEKFVALYSDAQGYGDMEQLYFLVNDSRDTANCLYARYDVKGNNLYLADNSGTAWKGGFAPGSANVIKNGYAGLDCSKVQVISSGNTIKVKWRVTFKPTFKGRKKLFLCATDSEGATSGLVKKGWWQIQ
jgi:hypothetical protein